MRSLFKKRTEKERINKRKKTKKITKMKIIKKF